MKEFLDREFWKWQDGDRTKTLLQFAEYLSVEYGALSAWMNGARHPKRDSATKLAEKLGLEAYDAAGFARPHQDGDTPIPGRFVDDWKHLSPEQRQEFEDFFATITAEELLEFLRTAIDVKRRKRGKREGGGAGSAQDESSFASRGGTALRKIGKRLGGEKA